MAPAMAEEIPYMLKDSVTAGQGMKEMPAICARLDISLLARYACAHTTVSKDTAFPLHLRYMLFPSCHY